MPRYTIEPRQSSRDKRLQSFQSMQEGDQRQQQIDSASQAQMLQQLATMYGLSQQSELAPLHQQELQANIASKQFETQHAPELLAAKLASEKAQQDSAAAQAGYYTSRSGGGITPRDLMEYEMHTGQPYITPEQRSQEATKKEAERQQAQAAEEARMTQPLPPHPDMFDRAAGLGGGIGGAYMRSIYPWLHQLLTAKSPVSARSYSPPDYYVGQ